MHWTYLQKVTDRYVAVLASTYRHFAGWCYDRGRLGHMAVVAADITPDFNHRPVRGMHKAALSSGPSSDERRGIAGPSGQRGS